MEETLNQLYNIEVTNKELRNIPDAHLGFLISSCLAITELNILLKPLIMSLNSRKEANAPNDKCLQEIAFVHEIIFQRNVASKLYEYINSLSVYQKKCSNSKDTSMFDFTKALQQEIDEIKQTEEYSILKWFRNKATNHYASSEFIKLAKNINPDANDMSHPFYLHPMQGNSYYLLGEQILLQKFSEFNADPYGALNNYSNWIRGVNIKIQKFHHDFCIKLFKLYLPGKKLDEISIEPAEYHIGDLTSTNMPLLWKFR